MSRVGGPVVGSDGRKQDHFEIGFVERDQHIINTLVK